MPLSHKHDKDTFRCVQSTLVVGDAKGSMYRVELKETAGGGSGRGSDSGSSGESDRPESGAESGDVKDGKDGKEVVVACVTRVWQPHTGAVVRIRVVEADAGAMGGVVMAAASHDHSISAWRGDKVACVYVYMI